MKVLELFSGSNSVGNVCEKLGYEVISVDITDHDGFFSPTHLVDIMDFDYKQYDHFDIIWASPPCINYSSLQATLYGKTIKGEFYTKDIHERNMKQSDIIVNKTLEIIKYFNPGLWFIENPAYSKLRERSMMKDIPNFVVSYCKYSEWGYRKNTRIWTNKKDFVPKKCKKDCTNMINGKHAYTIGARKGHPKRDAKYPSRYIQNSRIPPKLIEDLMI